MKKNTKKKGKGTLSPSHPEVTLETFKYPSCLKEGRRGIQVQTERESRKNSHPLRNASQTVFLFFHSNNPGQKVGQSTEKHLGQDRALGQGAVSPHSSACDDILQLEENLCSDL